ncbi:MAG TPA: MFS transporter [Verrucomicrobiae bacterium]|nr:MFS transporter [Verrucomicrobiae bacterium]
MSIDPRAVIAERPMGRAQIFVVALCIALNALDGFDVLSISFAAPGIAEEWEIDRATLGIVLSMELIGMALGSVLLGNVADRIGRRPTILGCLLIMASGMFLAAMADSVTTLSATRLYTGLGIGGMIATTAAVVAEFSNEKRRDLNAMLNIAGYSAGAILGGVVASVLLAQTGDWRTVFLFGGVVTALLFPLTYFVMPESIESLIARRPKNALALINRTLQRLKLTPIADLPAPATQTEKPSFTALFSMKLAPTTLLLTLAYFAAILSFYYIQKWTPKIVVDMGYEASAAGGVLVCASIGGLLGAVLLGLAVQRFPLRPIIIASLLAAFGAITAFGLGADDLTQLSLIVGVAGFCINGGVVGMYPIMARAFPAAVRASGTGFAIGIGRGGSAVGPVLAGYLFAGGGGLLLVSGIMGAGALLAAFALTLLPRSPKTRA